MVLDGLSRDNDGIILGDEWIYPLVLTSSLLLKMAIEIMSFLRKEKSDLFHGDVSLPEGKEEKKETNGLIGSGHYTSRNHAAIMVDAFFSRHRERVQSRLHFVLVGFVCGHSRQCVQVGVQETWR